MRPHCCDLTEERETVVHGDPLDEVRHALRAGLRPSGRVALASASAIDETFRPAHHPRANDRLLTTYRGGNT